MRTVIFAVLLIGMAVYVTVSAHRLFEIEPLKRTPAVLAWLLSALPAAAGVALIPATGGAAAAVIALAHLTALLVLWDAVFLFVRSGKKERTERKALLFAVSFVVCAAYISYGAVNAYTVTPTFYTVSSSGMAGDERLRIAHISDCHLGTTFDGEGFARHLEAINSCRPDILVITGDFADSRTEPGEMAAACAALENVHAPNGVFYVSGNHEGRMDSDKRGELQRLLEHHGVIVLEDEHVILPSGVALVGRKDAYCPYRLSVSGLMGKLESPKYTVFLDHQPREYYEYADNGAGLVLSGHTHAGQMFPLGLFIEAIGMGENTYGMEQRGDTTFIVSSGLSGLLPLRTEAKSEFVIIDIVSEQN